MDGWIGAGCWPRYLVRVFAELGCAAAAYAGMELLREADMGAQRQSSLPFRLLIGGRLVEGASTFAVTNPANEKVLALCPRADLAQLNEAVAAARHAFPAWAARPLRDRATLLRRLADALAGAKDSFAHLLTQEQGKPLLQAAREIDRSVMVMRAFATMDLPLKVLKETDAVRIVQQRTPLGVVAAITPWNAPLRLLTAKVAPALLAGNVLVAKPAPTTPLTTLRFGELCAGILPPGVINVITDLNDLGDALTGHPEVALVSFTGSIATGKKVMASVAGGLKRLTLELGGNDAAIVLDDVDPGKIAPSIFNAAMVNSGQVCVAAKRVYVPDSLYDAICAELEKLASAAIVGDGLAADTQLGPLQNLAHFGKVQGLLAEARAQATVLADTAPPTRPGYFIHPRIVRDIPDNARLVREEQFGPVLPVLRYSDLDDAIARANSTEYGLGATIWSSNPQRAYEVALKIQSGIVWINSHLDLPPDTPIGGAKQSGFGTEMGQQGLEQFTQAKIINIAK
jgi:acyl-CoA reductase-like NAD-dependent aldehyde dehydrogenase